MFYVSPGKPRHIKQADGKTWSAQLATRTRRTESHPVQGKSNMSDQRYRTRLISLRSQINANFDRLIGQATLANDDQEGGLIER